MLQYNMRCLIGLAGLALAGCAPPNLSYSAPAGTVDGRPVSPFPESREPLLRKVMGLPPRPVEILGVQAFADRLIGAHVADFAVHHRVLGHWTEFLYFYPLATSGPGPGLCRARVYVANGRAGDDPAKPGGSWQSDVFAVAGSVAPLPEPWPPGYRERLEAACRARRDMGHWYRAEKDRAYLGARLADAVVVAARRKGALPFRLSCPRLRDDTRPKCADDVRKVVASINPRAIAQVGSCFDEPGADCVAVGMAKFPGPSSIDEEQWILHIRHRNALRIESVAVHDVTIHFE